MQNYKIKRVQGESVLNVLERIYETQDATLAFVGDCGRGRCGTCGMKINGEFGLACMELAGDDLTLEPLPKGKLIRDLLVVDEPNGDGIDV